MKNLTNGVDIQGMGNTMDFKTVLTLYSSSFTEGFIKVLETYNTPINEYIEVKHKEIPIENSVRIKTVMNKGFEKLKNSLLREKLQKCEGLQFNPKLHVRVRDLKYKSIYDLDSLSKKKWIDFFTKGNVYVDINNSSSRISQRIFFDKSIVQFFGRTDNSLNWISQIKLTKPKRKYISGGRFGKVKGFNFYLQKNEKLKPFERRKLLLESENLISKLIDEEISKVGSVENINSQIVFLDSSHKDLELIEIWNTIYDNYGFRFDLFRDKLIRENLRGIKEFKNYKNDSEPYTPLKIDWLENRKIKPKIYDFG